MSIAHKAILIVSIPVLFELVFLALYFDAEKQSAEHRERQAHSTETALSVGRLIGLTNDAQSTLRAYAIAGDARLLKSFREAVPKLQRELAELQRLDAVERKDDGNGGPARAYRISDVTRVTTAAIAHLQDESAMLEREGHGPVLEHLKTDAANAALDEFKRVARGYQSDELAKQRYENAVLGRLANDRRSEATAVVAANIVLAMALFWFLQRHVRRRLRLVLQNMSRYAAGDALHAIEHSPDEIGLLDVRFREMAQQLDAARRELEHRHDELARLNVEKNHFMGMAAHDLRNPLFAALTSADVLIRRGDFPERDRAALQRMKTSLKAMSNLVTDFLDVALIESGELSLRVAPVDVAAIVRECCETAALLAEQKEIVLNCAAPEAIVAQADGEKIAQVLTNFLSNAIKYSPPRTRVDVSVARRDGMVQVSVRDEGTGIGPEEMARLFVPFSRTSARPTAGESSTGLGLAICRKIVEGHGGRVWAESELGKGSVFSFEIPLSR